jgi:hypothetical protein
VGTPGTYNFEKGRKKMKVNIIDKQTGKNLRLARWNLGKHHKCKPPRGLPYRVSIIPMRKPATRAIAT